MKKSQSLTRTSSRSKVQATVGTNTTTALTSYQEVSGQEIMRPDGNRAYLPTNLWAAPIWLPENRADKRRKYPICWLDKYGTKYEVNATEDLTADPDMGVLLGLIALWQDYMQQRNVFLKSVEEQTYVGIKIPMSRIYKATGYTYRTKQRLLESIKRLSTISAQIIFAKNQEGRPRGIKFVHFFDAEYIQPEKNGHAGRIEFIINRFFIPRPINFLWHPAKLCQNLKLPTSRLLFWGVANSLHGWKGTAKELYKLIYRTNSDEIDPVKIRKWKMRRLMPALQELEKNGFRITQTKNAYGEELIGIYWPSAKRALNAGTD